MSLSLKEIQAITDMSELLYDFLPGSGNPAWKGHVSYKSVTQKIGLADFWQSGSKLPMITALLEKTIDQRRHLFERLILEIIKSGILYRKKRKDPITSEEIDRLNGLLLEVGFKFPDLWDPDFHASLRIDGIVRAKKYVEDAIKQEKVKETVTSNRYSQLEEIKRDFFSLHTSSSPRPLVLILKKY